MQMQRSAERFSTWLETRVVERARGDYDQELNVEPSGKFWLGRLASEEWVMNRGLGERGERLEPCAVGIRFRPGDGPPFGIRAKCWLAVWLLGEDKVWRKAGPTEVEIGGEVPISESVVELGKGELSHALFNLTGTSELNATLRIESEKRRDGTQELAVELVNTSPQDAETLKDTNLYEVRLELIGVRTRPYELESLPDSFRYSRNITAYGINCGIGSDEEGTLWTEEALSVDRFRPEYWAASSELPDLEFESLRNEPLAQTRALIHALHCWGVTSWSADALKAKLDDGSWDAEMFQEASAEAKAFWEEYQRLKAGAALLEENEALLHAFQLMNRAMVMMSQGKYRAWRPFQIGFLLTTLKAVVEPDNDSDFADIVWFATGGGKTETYLGVLIVAAIYDRMTGKSSGISAWSRFPLRMLSLQQTQRFADALAAAEIVRMEDGIEGEPISLGFFVGGRATPNSIKVDAREGDPDPEDPNMPNNYRILLTCPFCHSDTVSMHFNRREWRLEHRCTNEACPWPNDALPFYIVDDEIYRFLPTVIVGTLDKAAGIGFQASMRGIVGPPWGVCSIEGHGYVYAPRSNRPTGCLVPDCRGHKDALNMDPTRFGPSFRLQDELHLLKDSLGAVDAHYESLLDDLQETLCGFKPKIIGSSATLSGYATQVDVLYQRAARAFPVQGPDAKYGFWTQDSRKRMRRYVSVAPRGVTLEYAIDRILTELQCAIREFAGSANEICGDLGIDPSHADELISLYGTNVVYGNTIRDLDAVQRSIETQIPVDGSVNTASLTGRTDFEEVRNTLSRLKSPEANFADRIHAITASSMMSHGVDISRLNILAVLGIPLTTAEFVQATARVGRDWPGLVFVVHKIGRERDAGVYRSFRPFIEQGDRFVEPVPVTRRSRRVLERTLPGLELARIRCLHEHEADSALTTVKRLRQFVQTNGMSAGSEYEALIRTLRLDDVMDQAMRDDLQKWLDVFFENLSDPAGNFKWLDDLCPGGGPMMSLRDVEEQVPVVGSLNG